MTDALVGLLARQESNDDEDTQRLVTLLELLDRPDTSVPALRVGGAGRGASSVAAMVVALLTALDVTAGSLTASHLQDLRERVRVAGTALSADTLRAQLDYLDPFLREVDTRFARPVTFDEVLVALAANRFADAPVDVAVYEGRPPPGGRADVTVDLGGPHGAIVTAEGGQPRVGGADFGILDRRVAVGGQQLGLRGVTGDARDVFLPLHGEHQAGNAAVALATVEGFLGFAGGLDVDLLRRGFAAVRLPGRLEVVRRERLASVLLDCARDGVGGAALAAALRTEFTVRNRVGVLAADATAPVELVAGLAPALDHAIVAPAPTPDAADAGVVLDAVRDAGLPAEQAATVAEALDLASGVATVEDAVVVAGGAHAVGAARTALGLGPAEDLVDMS